VLQPYDDSATPSANSSHADAEVKGRTVAVRRLEAPRAHLSGGGSICKQGGTGEDIAIQVQVTGGKGPYRILVHRDSQQGWMSVLGHDGRYSFDAKKKGVYWIGEVQDAHKCAWKEPSNRVEITHFPVALAAFKQQFIGLCPGDGPQEASVGVTARGSKAPWELAVLRNGRFHARGQPNSSGYFVFNTEEVVDGQAGDKYEIDKDTFTDSRGCLGEVRGSLTVQMNALPSVQVLSSDRQGRAVARAGTCEDEEMRLEFTAGTAPWSVTIELSSADDTPAGASIAQASLACEISGITQKIFSLSNLKDVRAGGATSGGGGGGGAGLLRTTCPGPASGRGFLPAGYHVITSVRGGSDDDASGRRMCRRDGISVPLVIHHKPRASVSRLVCKNLCKDEVASAMVNLTQGQPPFTVQLIDENDKTVVVEQKLNVSAGEFRLDRVRVVRGDIDPMQLNFDKRNWTVYSLRDANGCSTSMESGRIATVSAKTTTVSGSVSDGVSGSVIRSAN